MSAKEANRRVIILISGPHGTGKTTIARALARRFKMRYISAGEIFRKKARDLGFDIIEFTKYVEMHPEVDYEIDDQIKNELQKGNAVLDSQLAYFFAKFVDNSIIKISIMIYASLDTRIKRLMKREKICYEEAKKNIITREKSEQTRFKRLYGVDLWSIDDFDAIINTTYLTEDEAIELCISLVDKLIKIKTSTSRSKNKD